MSQALASAETPAGPPGSRGQDERSFDRHWYAWAMVLPTVVVLGVARAAIPLVRGVVQSFTDLTESNQQRRHLHQDPRRGGGRASPIPNACAVRRVSTTTSTSSPAREGDFWLQFVNTLVWTVACVAFHYGLGPGPGRDAQPRVARPRPLPGRC